MNSSDVLVSPSNDLARHAHDDGCRRKIEIIPHGVDPDRFDPEATQSDAIMLRAHLGIRADESVILYVGRLDRVKNLEALIHAAPKILQRDRNLKFLIAGEGPELDRLVRLASSNGVAASFIFAGRIPAGKAPSYYAAADLFVLTSHYESFGVAVLEAMAAAKPVIASRVGAIPEIVDDQVTGFLYSPGNYEALVDRILTALDDEDLRIRIGNSARQKVKTQYGWDQIAYRYSVLYARLS